MKSIQITDDDKSETELVTSGNFNFENGKYTVSYLDSEATGFEGSETKVTVMNNEIATITRRGTSISDLTIEPGKKHHCYYATPYGEMAVGIFTHKIENNLSENGGKLYMKYTIDINTSYVSDNEIILNVKETPQN